MNFKQRNFTFGKETAFLALAIITLFTLGAATAIIASSSNYYTNMFTHSLAGAKAEGSTYSARTHTTFITGTNNAQGGTNVANVGFFGSSVTSNNPPTILSAAILPAIVGNASSVNLFISSTYATYTYANITLPDTSIISLPLANEANTTFYQVNQPGTYSVMFIANNTNGIANYNATFESRQSYNYLLQIYNSTNGMNSSIRAAYSNYVYAQNSSEQGNLTILLPDLPYDAEVRIFPRITLNYTLNSTTSGDTIQFQETQPEGFLKGYHILTNLSMTKMLLGYSDIGVTNKNYLTIYSCTNYTIDNCTGVWQEISATNNLALEYFEVLTTGAYALKQTSPPAEEPQEQAPSSRGFYKRKDLRLEEETICDPSRTIITAIDDETNKPVKKVLITIKGQDNYYSALTDEIGLALFNLPNGEYFVLSKSDNYADEGTQVKVDCLEPKQILEPTVIDDEPKKEDNMSNKSSWVVEDLPAIPVEQEPAQVETPVESEAKPEQSIETKSKSSKIIPIATAVCLAALLLILLIKKKKPGDRKKERAAAIKEMTDKEEKLAVKESKPAHAEAKITQAEKKEINDLHAANPMHVHQSAPILPPKPIPAKLDATPAVIKEETKAIVHEPVVFKKEETTEQISPLLRDVQHLQEFILLSGKKVKSTAGLAMALSRMPDEEFNYHVTPHKNDFATWLYHAVQDKELAERIGGIKYKEQIIEELEKRINELLKKH